MGVFSRFQNKLSTNFIINETPFFYGLWRSIKLRRINSSKYSGIQISTSCHELDDLRSCGIQSNRYYCFSSNCREPIRGSTTGIGMYEVCRFIADWPCYFIRTIIFITETYEEYHNRIVTLPVHVFFFGSVFSIFQDLCMKNLGYSGVKSRQVKFMNLLVAFGCGFFVLLHC